MVKPCSPSDNSDLVAIYRDGDRFRKDDMENLNRRTLSRDLGDRFELKTFCLLQYSEMRFRLRTFWLAAARSVRPWVSA